MMTSVAYIVYISGLILITSFLGVLSAMESNRSIRSLQLYFGATLIWVGFEFSAAQVALPDIRIWLHRISGASAAVCAFLFFRFVYTLRYKPPGLLYRVMGVMTILSSTMYALTNWGIRSVGSAEHIGQLEFGWFYYIALFEVLFAWVVNVTGIQLAMHELPSYESARKHAIFLLQISTTVLSTIGIVSFIFSWLLWDVNLFFRWIPLLSVVFIPFFLMSFSKYGFLSTGMGSLARDLFLDAEDGILIADANGIVRQINPAACTLLSTEPEKAEGLPLAELLRHPVTPGERHFELSPKEISDLAYHLVGSITPVTTLAGASQQLVVMHDVTDEKSAEEAAARSREDFESEISQRTGELVELQEKEAIGTMAGSIAHDFNNLLAAVLGFATAAYQDVPDGTSLKRDVEEILNSARQAREVVNQLLLFSRRQQSKREMFNIEEMLRDTLHLVESSLPPNVSLRHPEHQNVYVMASRTDLSQLVMNLCTNGVQAIGDEDGQLSVLVKVDVQKTEPSFFTGDFPDEKNVQISVVDTGEGMSDEVKMVAFEPFFSTRENAIGFGLSTALRIAGDHSGGISIADNHPQGTAVSVYLPRLDIDELVPAADTTSLAGGETIMVIDDDERLLRLVSRLLSSAGYRVALFSDPLAALQAFRRTPGAFDLVVSDFVMPNLTGVELARLLIEERGDLSILLISGNVSEADLASSRQEGIRGFLAKPFGREELLGKVRRLLDDRSRVSFIE